MGSIEERVSVLLLQVPLEKVCTEGKSLFEEEDRESWNLAYSQYPRPSIEPSYDSDQPKIANYMGYSVNDKNFRATIWTEFNSSSMKGNFDRIIAEELYDHGSDPLETKNVAGDPKHKKTLDTLSMAIRRRFDPPSSSDSLLPWVFNSVQKFFKKSSFPEVIGNPENFELLWAIFADFQTVCEE